MHKIEDTNMPPVRLPRRPMLRRIVVVGGLVLLSILLLAQLTGSRKRSILSPSNALEFHFSEPKPIQTFQVSGFANSRVPDGTDCNQIRIDSSLGITQSIYVEDDMLDIAASINHPLIDYSGQEKGQSFASMVEKTWGRMSGSSVWLAKYEVYLTVARVFFYDKGVKHWPINSFIRAQLHDANWKHLDNHTLDWQGEQFTFPRVMEIQFPWEPGGGFYGPEDPRIILESGVDDAEPVVLFNMIDNLNTVARTMHAFRPFSNFTTTLRIENRDQAGSEKNWAPFFLSHTDSHPLAFHRTERRYPSRYLHFVYDFHPLRILRCHLLNGACAFVYEQPMPEAYLEEHKHNDTEGVMRGGTNFEPLSSSLQTRPGLTSFIGWPRTHTDAACGNEAIYRPELMVLTTNGSDFSLDYSSEALDFGTTLLTQAQKDDTCDTGRILIANSIARIHDDKHGKNKDTMLVSFSVGDATVQIAEVSGVQRLIRSLPQFQPDALPAWQESDMQWNINVTSDVLICSVQSASDYAVAATKQMDPARLAEIS